MNRNFIFAFILLAALSMVNAIPHQLYKRGLQCPLNLPITFVATFPDPLVSGSTAAFTLSGTFSSDVSTGSVVNIAFFDSSDITGFPIGTFAADFCATQGISCPISAGVEFNSVVQGVSIPDNLPSSLVIVVAVIDLKAQKVVGCTISGANGSS